MKTSTTLHAIRAFAALAAAAAVAPLSAQQNTAGGQYPAFGGGAPAKVYDVPAETPSSAPAAPAASSAGAVSRATAASPGKPSILSEIQSAAQGGKVSLDMRLRYEFVDQSFVPHDANALTLRTRLGYTTAAWHGLDIGLEAENVVPLVTDYNNSIEAKPGYPVVMDPAVTEVNQAWIRYTNPGLGMRLTGGRQRIILDNSRFVGDVGWRQDNQTFDALRLQNFGSDNLSLSYAYLWRINRVQADERDWRSNSHLVNLSYKGAFPGTFAAYGYLLDFEGPRGFSAPAVASSSQTYGASFTGEIPLTNDKAVKLTYRAEYAIQSQYGDNKADYRADYVVAEVGVSHKIGAAALGYEVLGSDNGQGFRTPLGTNHIFNGWSDWATPVGNGIPRGLRDLYLNASAPLPWKIQLTAYYHSFETDSGGEKYGNEIDVQLAWRLNQNIAFLVKGAVFDSKMMPQQGGANDVAKFWVQTEYSF